MAGLSRLGVGLGSVLSSEDLVGGVEGNDDDNDDHGDGIYTAPAEDFADITEVC